MYKLLSFLIFSILLNAQIFRYDSDYGSSKYLDAENLFYENLHFESDLILRTLEKHYPNTSTKDKEYLLHADIAIKEGSWTQSKNILNDFITKRAKSPFTTLAKLKIAQIAFTNEDYIDAADKFEKTKVDAQNNFELRKDSIYLQTKHFATYWQAISIALTGSYKDAELIFKEISDSEYQGKYSDDALFALGQTAELFKQYQDAINIYQKNRVEYPKSNSYLRSLIREANNHLSLRNPSKAITALEKANRIWNQIVTGDSIGGEFEDQTGLKEIHQEIIYLRGEASNLSGNFNEAVIYFQTFLQTYVNSPIENLVRLGLAWSYLNRENFNRSMEQYQSVLVTNNNKWFAQDIAKLYVAIIHKKKGELQVAKQKFADLALNSDYPFIGEVLLELGQMYYEDQDYESARRTLERASQEAIDVESSTRIFLLLGANYIELKQYQEAIKVYDKAHDLAYNSKITFLPNKEWYLSEIYYKRGICYAQTRRSNKAVKDLSAFISKETSKERLVEGYFWLAESYYDAQLFKNSAQIYSRMLSEFPNSLRRQEVLYGLAWSYFRQNDLNRSTKVFEQLVDEYPGNDYSVEIIARIADSYYLRKNYSKASEYYNKVVRMNTSSEETEYAAYQLCNSLYRERKFEQAVDQLQNFINRYMDSKYASRAMYMKAYIRKEQNRYMDAIANFEFLLDAFPQSEYILITKYSIAGCYYNAGKYRQAIEVYKEIAERYRDTDIANKSMDQIAQASYLLGENDEYSTFLNNYESMNIDSPFNAKFRQNLADNYWSGGQPKKAIEEYKALLDKYPNYDKIDEVIYNMADSYKTMELIEEAENAYDLLLSKYPKSSYADRALLNFADMIKETNDYPKADSLYLMLENKYPEKLSAPNAGFQRASMAMVEGDTTRSIEIFKHVFNDYKTNDYSLVAGDLVAKLYSRRGLQDSAIEIYSKLTEQNFNIDIAAEAQYEIGKIHKSNEDYELAETAFLKVKENFTGIDDWFSRAILDLGEIYENNKRWLEAAEQYNILLELRPEDEFGITAKQRMKRVNKNLSD